MTVVDKIRRRTPQAFEEFTYARAKTDKLIKVTLPSPMLLATLYAPGPSSNAYPDPFALDLTETRQANVIRRVETILGSDWAVASSQRLLTELDKLKASRRARPLIRHRPNAGDKVDTGALRCAAIFSWTRHPEDP